MPRTALEVIQKHYPHVTKRLDGKSDVVLQVTEADCRKARPKDVENCALALSADRLPDIDAALIFWSIAYLIKGDTAYRYIVPERNKRETASLDRGGSFTPGTYKLKKPWCGNSLSGLAKQKPHPTKHKGSGHKKAAATVVTRTSTHGIRSYA